MAKPAKKKRNKKKVAAAAGAAFLASRHAENAARGYIFQSEWERPNGEKVKLKGFSKREMGQITPALHAIDQHTKTRHKINSPSISHHKFALHSRPLVGGVTKYQSHKIKLNSAMLRKLHKDGDPHDQVFHTVVHEAAHGIDSRFQHSHVGFAKETGWRHQPGWRNLHALSKTEKRELSLRQAIRSVKVSDSHKMQKRNEYYGRTGDQVYSAVGAHEHFAETYAKGIETKSHGHSPGVYSGQHYMHKQIYAHTPNAAGRIHTVGNQHARAAGLAVGTAATVGAGYYAYKHRDDIRRKATTVAHKVHDNFHLSQIGHKDFYYRHINGRQERVRNGRRK